MISLPPLSSFYGYFSETAKSKMLMPSVFPGALLTDMLSVAHAHSILKYLHFGGLLKLYLCIITHIVHRQRKIRVLL